MDSFLFVAKLFLRSSAQTWLPQYGEWRNPGFIFVTPVELPAILDLFCDGACWCPAYPAFRVAAWSVVVQLPCSSSSSLYESFPVCAQPLSGLVQTIFRAELRALLAALEFGIHWDRHMRIWSDCQAVVSGFDRYVRGRVPLSPNAAHADLWKQIQELAWDFGLERVQVIKVPAHTHVDADTSDFEQWYIWGNRAADRAAKGANAQRGLTVWRLWQQVVDSTLLNREQFLCLWRHMVAVAELWHPESVQNPVTPEPRTQQVKTARKFCSTWECPETLPPCGPAFKRLFGSRLLELVKQWFHEIHDPQCEVQWISFYQLFVHFHAYADVAVTKVDGKWNVDWTPGARLANHVRLALRVKYFRLMLQQFFRDHSVNYHTATLRPRSDWICCHRGSVAMPVHSQVWRAIEERLSQLLVRPAIGQGKGLESIVL